MEDINDLDPYLTFDTLVRGSVLITTQKPIECSAIKDVDIVTVKSFGRVDAAALLFKYIQAGPTDEEETAMARELSDTVDGLPLAIATMGGYINQSESHLGDFVRELKTSSDTWTASAVSPVKHYEKNLETIFDIAIRGLS